jgi:hypothetical protein
MREILWPFFKLCSLRATDSLCPHLLHILCSATRDTAHAILIVLQRDAQFWIVCVFFTAFHNCCRRLVGRRTGGTSTKAVSGRLHNGTPERLPNNRPIPSAASQARSGLLHPILLLLLIARHVDTHHAHQVAARARLTSLTLETFEQILD